MSDRAEQLKQPPTAEQIETSLRRVGEGKVRRCIPVEPDDDDVVLSNAIDHLRAALATERARAEQAEREYAHGQLKWEGTLRALAANIEQRKAAEAALREARAAMQGIANRARGESHNALGPEARALLAEIARELDVAVAAPPKETP